MPADEPSAPVRDDAAAPRPANEPRPLGRAGWADVRHAGAEPWVQLRNATYSPLLFKKMVGRADPKARPGDFVAVYNRDGAAFGRGFYNPRSQIAVRLLSFTAEPTPADDLIAGRIAAAVKLRRELLRLDAVTDAYRVVHAEGDGLSGLIVDRFGDFLVVELFALGFFRKLELVERVLKTHFPGATVLVRADEKTEQHEGFKLQSPRSADRGQAKTVITEHGVRFQVEFAGSHKTGFFCDQRDNRRRLCDFTAGAEVLDVCSYTGGFGVYAAVLGGAEAVTCVDLDEYAVELVKRNAGINGVRVQAVHADGFAYLRQMQANGRRFGVVVLDPSKLIGSREEFDEGRKKYFDFNKLAIGVVKPGGILLTCSCSGLVDSTEFFNIVRGAARSAGRRVQVLATTGAGPDHPVMTECPESAYLKAIWCRVE
jgi:23S rRNA (cytosine1962-C5)-methyltransferase